MESFAQQHAKKEMKHQESITCKNGDFELQGLKIINKGCKEPRRHGSAWCQECSDEHKELQNV